MKRIYFFTLLAIIPMTLARANDFATYNSIYGLWDNVHYNESIQIKRSGKGIKVRQGHYGHWRRYDKIAYGLYDDCYGSQIRFVNDYTLEWRRKYRHRTMRFVKREANNYGGYHDHDYGHGHDDFRDAKYVRKKIKGKWRRSDRYEKLKIKTSKYGIKVRRDREDTWHDYEQDPYDVRRFTNRKGNAFVLVNEYELVWEGRRGRRLYFEKD